MASEGTEMNTFTAQVISKYTKRNCIRFTEMAYVLVAVFDCGRPQFVSKRKLYERVVCQECRDGAKLQAEWSIGLTFRPEPRKIDRLAVIEKRVARAGFTNVRRRGNAIVGDVPRSFADVALQVAKEQGWRIDYGTTVIAA